MATTSASEGLIAPASCTLIVRSVRLVAVEEAASNDCERSAGSCALFGMVIVSVCGGHAEGGASTW